MEQSSYKANSGFNKSRNPPPFMESEGLFPCSQEPAIGLYPEPDKSNPHPPNIFP
jgi:hypothetical protein